MQQRESAADRTVREIAVSLATQAEVLLSAGAPQYAALLKDRVEAAAKAASIRLYPQFDTADNQDWETVVKHAQAGRPDALKAVGHNGASDTELVCQTLCTRLGAGRKG